MKKEISTKRFFSLMAFVAVVFLAVALLLSLIAGSGESLFAQIANIIKRVAQAIAYVCACISAFSYVRSKRNPAYMILYIIACIMIAVFVVLPLFGIAL